MDDIFLPTFVCIADRDIGLLIKISVGPGLKILNGFAIS